MVRIVTVFVHVAHILQLSLLLDLLLRWLLSILIVHSLIANHLSLISSHGLLLLVAVVTTRCNAVLSWQLVWEVVHVVVGISHLHSMASSWVPSSNGLSWPTIHAILVVHFYTVEFSGF